LDEPESLEDAAAEQQKPIGRTTKQRGADHVTKSSTRKPDSKADNQKATNESTNDKSSTVPNVGDGKETEDKLDGQKVNPADTEAGTTATKPVQQQQGANQNTPSSHVPARRERANQSTPSSHVTTDQKTTKTTQSDQKENPTDDAANRETKIRMLHEMSAPAGVSTSTAGSSGRGRRLSDSEVKTSDPNRPSLGERSKSKACSMM
jgi:hypothetical protein